MSNRKLLNEVERTLKKVDEGIEQFDEYLDKLNNSTTASQKERWESEMKKEIKRLQRLRDQIKAWQTSNEIKDKDPLAESRKKIEALMEKFKLLEKDLKIKAYSREGLMAASKLDPKEKEKAEATSWIQNTVDRLKTQVDVFEAELEAAVLSGGGKKGKKGDKSGRAALLDGWLIRHKLHIDNLEILLRLIENEDIQPDEIYNLREYMDEFLERHEESDFVEDETIYDEFDLSPKEDISAAPKAVPKEEKEPSPEKQEEKKASAAPAPVPIPKTSMPSLPLKKAEEAPKEPEAPKSFEAPAKIWSNLPRSQKKDDIDLVPLTVQDTEKFVMDIELNLPVETGTTENHFLHPSLYGLEKAVMQHYAQDLGKAKQQGKLLETFHRRIPIPQSYAVKTTNVNPIFEGLAVPIAFEKPSFYEKLDLDTLFSIFYYMPCTYYQYLSARELKRQSWRFHKKYLTWFQRHEEPKVITEDYEQGTYVYFDYDGSWCQRKKSDFTFEYRFLEDAELV